MISLSLALEGPSSTRENACTCIATEETAGYVRDMGVQINGCWRKGSKLKSGSAFRSCQVGKRPRIAASRRQRL